MVASLRSIMDAVHNMVWCYNTDTEPVGHEPPIANPNEIRSPDRDP